MQYLPVNTFIIPQICCLSRVNLLQSLAGFYYISIRSIVYNKNKVLVRALPNKPDSFLPQVSVDPQGTVKVDE